MTHPARWGSVRIDLLLRAARSATDEVRNWPDPTPLPEPVAAAQGVLGLSGPPSQARIAVLDLGGGTVDVRRSLDRIRPELRVVGIPQGMDQVSGESSTCG